ncbi:phosphotransferase family protein [Gordonia sp. PKS22-38]|uniref:Phosphotransferase family protein n=1 Tax=Gordonia prachuapensis TaxID=3115651 RepID=A0ABU7N0C7_9ACTN|nr:phosphotransferase family protein [Gordonia sp. PKS22-38]
MKSTDPAEVGTRIAGRLGAIWGREVAVRQSRVLPAGASRTTYALTVGDGSGDEAVIVRAVPAAEPGSGGLTAEVDVLRAAMDAGVPVPEVLDLGDSADGDNVLGFPYALMRFVDGESIARRILRDDAYGPIREDFARQAGGILARIHAMDTATTGLTSIGDPVAALRTLFPREYEEAPAGIVLAIDWLERNRPEPSPETVVHGDFRLGNLLITPDRISAVLDWELAHLGDPMEDLGWLCAKAWRFGAGAPVAGMGSRADLLDAYAQVSGRRPDEATLKWWELYATVRWGLICGAQANRYLDGTEPSMELAAIGRRSAEQEFDALLALGITTPQSVSDPLEDAGVVARPEDPHTAPTMLDLLDSVSGFLHDEVAPDSGVSSQVKFRTRVAGNVLATVRRQLLVGERQAEASRRRLSALGVGSSAELADALRRGSLSATDENVRSVVAAEVIDRLTVANPRHMSRPDS